MSLRFSVAGLVLIFGIIAFVPVYLARPYRSANTQVRADLSQREFQFRYEVKVKNLHPQAKPAIVWIPIPNSDEHQKISDLRIGSDYPYSIYQEPQYGNTILKIEADSNLPDSLLVSVSFTVLRRAMVFPGQPGSPTVPLNTLNRFLSPDRLVPISGAIEEETHQVVKQGMSDLEKAKVIYDYVVKTLKYDKSGTGWGRGDALHACQTLRGNCTDFHSLFIGMARAGGIPARFVMGFPVPQDRSSGEVSSYHCWAEFYIKGTGWVAVDASEANQHPESKEFYFGNLDPNRVKFTVGRDIQIDPAGKIDPLNYFIYPYVLVGGKAYEDVEMRFGFTEQEDRNGFLKF